MRVVLLHGLSRTRHSMGLLARDLEDEGFDAVSLPYDSRRRGLRELAADLAVRLRQAGLERAEPGFVCHSMGGLLLRALPLAVPGFRCARSVLIGCPMQGSLVAEQVAQVPLARWLLGPSLSDLVPAQVRLLPGVPGPFAVIAGSTFTPLVPAAHFLRRSAPGEPSDSTVRVSETVSEDAEDHLVVRGVHTLLPWLPEVRRQVVAYLRGGAFLR